MMAANWKMNKTVREAQDYMAALLPRAADAEGVDVAVFVPFTCLNEVARMTEDSGVIAGAQNFFYEDSGAFTGEVSAPMLQDLGAEAVLVGHSERREIFGENDDTVSSKTAAPSRPGSCLSSASARPRRSATPGTCGRRSPDRYGASWRS